MLMKKNNLNSDGSVNSYNETKILGHGYHIPFTDTTFDKQIEQNIFLPVFILNAKGFITHTSCHGHSQFSRIFKGAIRSNSGPQITVQVPISKIIEFNERFNSALVTTELNTTIENHSRDFIFVSIRIRTPYNRLFTNKFLCNQILKLCEALPYT
jgi:hypothetical protein